MKREKIVLFGDPVLRETARPVTVFHKKLHALIDSIKFTLSGEEDGAALAANQVGILRRIVVISYMGEYFEMVNPEILESSGVNVDMEGCLSLPGYSGNVRRAEHVKVGFRDRHGKEMVIERSGRMARCIQHEIDHLDGVLFIDRMDEPFVACGERRLRVSDLLKITPAGGHGSSEGRQGPEHNPEQG